MPVFVAARLPVSGSARFVSVDAPDPATAAQALSSESSEDDRVLILSAADLVILHQHRADFGPRPETSALFSVMVVGLDRPRFHTLAAPDKDAVVAFCLESGLLDGDPADAAPRLLVLDGPELDALQAAVAV